MRCAITTSNGLRILRLDTVQFTFNGDGTNAVFQTDEDIGRGGSYYLEYDFTAARGDVSLLLTDESSQANYGPMIYAITLQQTAAAPAPVAPVINTQPVGFTNWTGLSGSLSVSASGNPAPAYQWYQNSSPLSGATTAMPELQSPGSDQRGFVLCDARYHQLGGNGSTAASCPWASSAAPTSFRPRFRRCSFRPLARMPPRALARARHQLSVRAGFWPLGLPGATINGINFTPVNLTSATTTQSGTDPNYGGTWTASTTDTLGFRDVAGGGASVTAQADGQMVFVLTGASYVGVAPVATTITFDFGVLTPGRSIHCATTTGNGLPGMLRLDRSNLYSMVTAPTPPSRWTRISEGPITSRMISPPRAPVFPWY